MSVFTQVGGDQLEEFLCAYDVGELQDYRGISAGIENTNYFVDTDQGRFVLTLFEHQTGAELRFPISLMELLADAGVPTARPIRGRDGDALRQLAGKPTALVTRLSGKAVESPSVTHCGVLGSALADLHLAGQQQSIEQSNLRGAEWFKQTARKVKSFLSGEQASLLDQEMSFQQGWLDQHPEALEALPTGVIHADLFRDNALWDGEQLVGIIDLYAACHDHLLYDLAICVNDWCIDEGGEIDDQRARAMIGAYASKRALTENEKQSWSAVLRRAALRFWLSRLYDKHFPRPGELTTVLDPDHFVNVLRARRACADNLSGLLVAAVV